MHILKAFTPFFLSSCERKDHEQKLQVIGGSGLSYEKVIIFRNTSSKKTG